MSTVEESVQLYILAGSETSPDFNPTTPAYSGKFNFQKGITYMTQQEIEGKLIQVISTITNQDAAEISPEKPFHELGIDSLGFVEILVFIEKTLKLQLIASQLNRKDFESVRALSTFISTML